MKIGKIPYPCIGYCIIDSRGYCVACGRPPTLGAPETCAKSAGAGNDSASVANKTSELPGETAA